MSVTSNATNNNNSLSQSQENQTLTSNAMLKHDGIQNNVQGDNDVGEIVKVIVIVKQI